MSGDTAAKAMITESLNRLLKSEEPSVRYYALTEILAESEDSRQAVALREEIRSSPRVKALLSSRDATGRIPYPVYAKWYGAHWILLSLAQLGYPPGDKSLIPLRDQVLDCWTNDKHVRGVSVVDGRARRCGSQEGNALWAILKLGVDDGREKQLADNLMQWQWPDGGWNCDGNPSAMKSSFHETLWPMRALALYGQMHGDKHALQAAHAASEIFLKRHLFRRLSDGALMDRRFLEIHYPYYWRYNVLAGLKVLAEIRLVRDPRCSDALDWLEAKRLTDGGFPLEKKYFRPVKSGEPKPVSGSSPVGWGASSKSKSNDFVSAESLYVLAKAGRVQFSRPTAD